MGGEIQGLRTKQESQIASSVIEVVNLKVSKQGVAVEMLSLRMLILSVAGDREKSICNVVTTAHSQLVSRLITSGHARTRM